MCNFIKGLIYTNKSGRLRELKNKGEVQLGNPKSGRGGLREIFITKLKSKFQRGFTKVVVTWGGRLREWSWGELWLYYTAFSVSLTLNSITQPARSNCRVNFGTVCSSFPALCMATCSLSVSGIQKYFNSLGLTLRKVLCSSAPWTCIGYVLYHSSLRTSVRSEIGLGKTRILAWNKVKVLESVSAHPFSNFSQVSLLLHWDNRQKHYKCHHFWLVLFTGRHQYCCEHCNTHGRRTINL